MYCALVPYLGHRRAIAACNSERDRRARFVTDAEPDKQSDEAPRRHQAQGQAGSGNPEQAILGADWAAGERAAAAARSPRRRRIAAQWLAAMLGGGSASRWGNSVEKPGILPWALHGGAAMFRPVVRNTFCWTN